MFERSGGENQLREVGSLSHYLRRVLSLIAIHYVCQEPHYMPTFREHRNETANPRALPSNAGPNGAGLKRAGGPNGGPMVARSAVFAAAKKLKSCVF